MLRTASLLGAAIENPRVWLGLARLDIVLSYRRTFFGPLWITFSLAIFVGAMTLVYGALFGIPPERYIAYVTCGMIAWTWFASLLLESGSIFINATHFVKNTRLDKAQLIWAQAWKTFIVFLHNLLAWLVILPFSSASLTSYTLLIIPATLILYLFSVPTIAILAILLVRYRDLQRLLSSGIIVLMMVTPVFWRADMIEGWRSAFVYWNPAYYLIEVLRRPLLGEPLEWGILGVVLAMTGVVWIIGGTFYLRYHRYVVFWI